MMDLSILITSYNNAQYIEKVIERVRINFPEAEIIIVDDCSTDGSDEILENSAYPPNTKVWWNTFNMGYGFSLRQGIKLSYKEYIAFQDSDLEYDPYDIYPLYWTVSSRQANYPYGVMYNVDVAYGRRSYYKVRSPISFIGRQIVNGLFYILFGFKIRDVCTAYKVMPRQLLLDMDTQTNGFEFGIELTAKLLRSGYKIIEIPVSYHPRTVAEGKSIRWSDAVKMIKEMIKWRFK